MIGIFVAVLILFIFAGLIVDEPLAKIGDWWDARPWNHCVPGCKQCVAKTCLPRAKVK